MEQQLTIDILHGSWMVNIIDEHHDDGVYELVSPVKTVTLHLNLDHLHGFEYSVVAKPGTHFVVTLDETVLVEGDVGPSGISRGRGIV
jgi:hypothetical protein